jgi:O-antigen biosynthesis protein
MHTTTNTTRLANDLMVIEKSTGFVDFATWLSEDILLLTGWLHVPPGANIQASLMAGDQVLQLDIRYCSYHRSDILNIDEPVGKILLVHLPIPGSPLKSPGPLVLSVNGITINLAPQDLGSIVTDPQTVIDHMLGALAPDERAAVIEMLTIAPAWYRGSGQVQLGQRLLMFREPLRVRLPPCTIEPTRPQGLYIDVLLATSPTSFYIRGWMRDSEAAITQLTVVSPQGCRVELHDQLFRFARPDVEQFYAAPASGPRMAKSGFLCAFTIPSPSHLQSGWVLELRNAAGSGVEIWAPPVISDPVAVREALLSDLTHERLPECTLIRHHTYPGLSRLLEYHFNDQQVERVIQYGAPVAAPEVSIIVPLYKRIDFVEHQLAQFANDPELRGADLIYVLDSPELADTLVTSAAKLFRLYGVPFQVVILAQNLGYAPANTAGAAHARGRLLLLLNSDVIPDRPGWLGKMVRFYDATPQIGALGPKLLYEDDALQHAGMYFSRNEETGVWENEHYFKGLHRTFAGANFPRAVPAVTGACLMIASNVFHRLGGLRGLYVQGDYEDSDLCLRLNEAGYENWYLPDVELYHLEGQSYPGQLRYRTSQYNSWIHTCLWDEQIEAIMDRQDLGGFQ